MSASFDALEYFENPKSAGVPEAQARVQANALRVFSSVQEENIKKELATKGDFSDIKSEIAEINARLRETELRLKYSLLKWQFGIAFALAAIMAKGFGWLGF